MKKFDKRKVVTGALVVAVALSSFAVSGTYARYTSDASVSDKARVAIWGWDSNNKLTLDLFKTSYKASDDATKTDVVSKTAGDGENAEKVIGPGTSGVSGFGLPTFKPETNYTITLGDNGSVDGTANADGSDSRLKYYAATVAKTDYDAAVAADKMSIVNNKINLNGSEVTTYGPYTSITDLIDGINAGGAADNDGLSEKIFAANSSANDSLVYLIGWEWAIGDTAADISKDTGLGNTAGTMPTVELKLKATYTQSEKAAN